MPLPPIVISKRNPHLLETGDGKPFLMLGDTAWELFHRLTIDEIGEYLDIRASQGFNTVWANILPEFDGLRVSNRDGHLPFKNADPSKPNEEYFSFVDRVVDLAADQGIYMGLLPAWGDKLTAPWGAGPAVFRNDNLHVAREYASWLGQRYRDRSNIVWVLGGDRPPKLFGDEDVFPSKNAIQAGLSPDSDWTPIWRAMADGLDQSGANQLTTYHPQGGTFSTSIFLHHEPWLDTNAMQSGHGAGHDVPVWECIERDYKLSPAKPTLDAEPNYEDHPVNPWPVWDLADGFFDDYDVRKQIYRSIFAGGCGVIYGHHCVWQFASDLYEPVLTVLFDWKTALHRPGAKSIRHLAKLIASVDLIDLVPDQSRIVGNPGDGADHARAIRSQNETLVYVPNSRSIELDLSWAKGKQVSIEEFDPVIGEYQPIAHSNTNEMSIGIAPVAAPKDRVIVIRVQG